MDQLYSVLLESAGYCPDEHIRRTGKQRHSHQGKEIRENVQCSEIIHFAKNVKNTRNTRININSETMKFSPGFLRHHRVENGNEKIDRNHTAT